MKLLSVDLVGKFEFRARCLEASAESLSWLTKEHSLIFTSSHN
jgi:hypothetical protein